MNVVKDQPDTMAFHPNDSNDSFKQALKKCIDAIWTSKHPPAVPKNKTLFGLNVLQRYHQTKCTCPGFLANNENAYIHAYGDVHISVSFSSFS
jgi:hypothetical protein